MSETWFDYGVFETGGFPLEHYAAEERVFSIGEPGSRMYVVKAGQVNLVSFGTVLENVRPCGIFGEMSLIDGEPRSANAIAMEPTTLAPIDKAAFAYLVGRDPDFALGIMRRLADRIRRMNQNL